MYVQPAERRWQARGTVDVFVERGQGDVKEW